MGLQFHWNSEGETFQPVPAVPACRESVLGLGFSMDGDSEGSAGAWICKFRSQMWAGLAE